MANRERNKNNNLKEVSLYQTKLKRELNLAELQKNTLIATEEDFDKALESLLEQSVEVKEKIDINNIDSYFLNRELNLI